VKRALLIAVMALALPGCALMPEWRVFQKKVPASMGEKPPAQVEGEKQGAAFIRAVATPPVADPAKAVAAIYPVATALSASLGEPVKPVTVADQDAIINSLRAGLAAKDAQLDKWRQFGRKYAGAELEGTGIDVAGPTGLLILAAIVAACIFVPGFGYLALRVVPLLWRALRQTAVGIESFAKENVEAGATLKTDFLARKMDNAPKKLVKNLKTRINPGELETAPAT
jgi:hypothetical protein